MNIGIIGGGASGMILASKLKNKNVTLIERNNKLGKKLLLTGNGKCNYTNLNFNDLSKIYNNDFAGNLYKKYDNRSFIEYFKELGIVPKVETHKGIDYIYPNSNKSTSVCYCLLDRIMNNGVNIIYDSEVTDINYSNNKFKVIINENKELEFNKIVLSTGGKSYKNTGSDGSGHKLAKKLGHKVVDLLPGLTALKFTIDEKDTLKFYGKCRVNANVSYQSTIDNCKYEEFGEIQFSDNSISGIPILNLSNKIVRDLVKKSPIKVSIDFSDCLLNDIDNKDKVILDQSAKVKVVKDLLFKRKENTNYRKTLDFLCGYLPDEVNDILLKVTGISNKSLESLNESDFEKLAKSIVSFTVYINQLPSFDNAQITLGGIDVNEIDLKTLESKIVKGLYFIGEIINIDGICGGYNLQLAYSTASVVADNI